MANGGWGGGGVVVLGTFAYLQMLTILQIAFSAGALGGGGGGKCTLPHIEYSGGHLGLVIKHWRGGMRKNCQGSRGEAEQLGSMFFFLF